MFKILKYVHGHIVSCVYFCVFKSVGFFCLFKSYTNSVCEILLYRCSFADLGRLLKCTVIPVFFLPQCSQTSLQLFWFFFFYIASWMSYMMQGTPFPGDQCCVWNRSVYCLNSSFQCGTLIQFSSFNLREFFFSCFMFFVCLFLVLYLYHFYCF